MDFDFGGPAILVGTDEGELLIAGQKSGDLWALNPETGALVWNQRVGEGTALGGNHWLPTISLQEIVPQLHVYLRTAAIELD